MKILIDNGHGIQTKGKRPQTAPSSNTPTPENSQGKSSQLSKPEATTPNSWFLKTMTSLYQNEYDAPTPIVGKSGAACPPKSEIKLTPSSDLKVVP